MNIYCDCSLIYEGSSNDLVKTKQVKARKQHRCCECYDPIKKGETYEVTDGCWDGSWGHYKTCLFCVMLRGTYCPGGYIYTELAETIHECLGFWYPEDPATYKNADREPELWQFRVLEEERQKERRKK